MEKWADILLLVVQLGLFLLGRLLDDMSWYDVGVQLEVVKFESVALTAMAVAAAIKLVRKWEIEGILKILFWRSQLKFLIPWSLTILIVVLFFSIFGCTHEVEPDYFFVQYDGCCLNATQLLLTNLNYSLLCNTKAHPAELIVYELVLFGEIIYNGTLLLYFVNHMEGKTKDYSILFVSIVIANMVLIMDLLFRGAYEDKEREEEDAHRLAHTRIMPELNSTMELLPSKSK